MKTLEEALEFAEAWLSPEIFSATSIETPDKRYGKGPKCPKCLGDNTYIVRSFYQEADACRGMNEIDADECFCNSCKTIFYW